LFAAIAKLGPTSPEHLPLKVVIPGFIISELRTAFQMGFLLFVPFILIDLVVATVLMSMGMMMMPPATISLPLKILLFVLVDGWELVVRSLVLSFGG
jgi:flagellar biosynthetic protein FliP